MIKLKILEEAKRNRYRAPDYSDLRVAVQVVDDLVNYIRSDWDQEPGNLLIQLGLLREDILCAAGHTADVEHQAWIESEKIKGECHEKD